ncbi:MAG: NAD(P)H-dependent oxidoreductase, partial [Gammaproteobacteria bacterium]|nr:NAD(P)H-dependent oxidoreductase [Gammaproteobacteria bacterium]
GQSAWADRPGAVVSLSPGALGGFGANHHLRQCLVFLDVAAMAQPEVYLSHADKALDGGKIVDARVRDFLTDFMGKFAQWVESHARRR